MSDRKHTPDVLGEILGEVALVEPPDVVPSGPARRPERRAGTRAAARRQQAERAQSPAEAKLARWEYRIVSFQNHRGWRPRYINGEEIPDWMGGLLIHECLQALGQEGWEVAGASSGHALYGMSDYHQIYLKRAIAD